MNEINNYLNEYGPSLSTDIVEWLASKAKINKEIAQKLHLSTYTVKSHVHNILEKLTLNTRVQIAKHAHLSDAYRTDIDPDSLSQ